MLNFDFVLYNGVPVLALEPDTVRGYRTDYNVFVAVGVMAPMQLFKMRDLP